MKLIGGRL